MTGGMNQLVETAGEKAKRAGGTGQVVTSGNTAKYGQTYLWPNGVPVTLLKPRNLTPDEDKPIYHDPDGMNADGWSMYAVDMFLYNGSKQELNARTSSAGRMPYILLGHTPGGEFDPSTDEEADTKMRTPLKAGASKSFSHLVPEQVIENTIAVVYNVDGVNGETLFTY